MNINQLIFASFLLLVLRSVTSHAQLPDQYCNAYNGSYYDLPYSEKYSKRDSLGIIKQKEISGIDFSLNDKTSIWGINDSGNGPTLYKFSSINGNQEGLFILNGLYNKDWEDLSTGIHKEKKTIFIGDIGDNKAERNSYSIYLLDESEIKSQGNLINQLFPKYSKIRFQYQDGARDAEAMIYDPIDKKVFIITKRESKVGIYSVDLNTEKEIQRIPKIAQLPLTNVVAADFSKNGLLLVIKTYDSVYFWERTSPTQPFCELISQKPVKLKYMLEPQGESICINEEEFITLSEERFGITPYLFKYKK